MKIALLRWGLAAFGVLSAGAAFGGDLLDRYGSSVVTIQYVITMRYSGNSSDQDQITMGAMVGADGLVVAARSQIQPSFPKRFIPPGNLDFRPPEVESSNFRVYVSDEADPYSAALIAVDVDLDLAWLKLSGTKDREFDVIDFGKGAEPDVGDRVWALTRLPASFGRSAVVAPGWIAGRLRIPRPLFVVSGGLNSAVFDDSGRPVGFMVAQEEGAGPQHPNSPAPGTTPFMVPAELLAHANERAAAVSLE